MLRCLPDHVFPPSGTPQEHFNRLRSLPTFPTSHSRLSVTHGLESQGRDVEGQDAGVGSRMGEQQWLRKDRRGQGVNYRTILLILESSQCICYL